MPKPFPPEFRRDVVAVARSSGDSIAKVAKDFGISASCLQRWLAQEDGEDDRRAGAGTRQESAEVRELKRRNRVLEQENEILRRAAAYFAKEISPK